MTTYEDLKTLKAGFSWRPEIYEFLLEELKKKDVSLTGLSKLVPCSRQALQQRIKAHLDKKNFKQIGLDYLETQTELKTPTKKDEMGQELHSTLAPKPEDARKPNLATAATLKLPTPATDLSTPKGLELENDYIIQRRGKQGLKTYFPTNHYLHYDVGKALWALLNPEHPTYRGSAEELQEDLITVIKTARLRKQGGTQP